MRNIRQGTQGDIDALLLLFEEARGTIAALGIDQWQNGYPSREVILRDIESGESFLVEENGVLVATFVMLKGEEPTYREIFNGEWMMGKDGAYTAIHRFAIAKTRRGDGIAEDILDFAARHTLTIGKHSLRIDTHEGNSPMRRMLERNGFSYVGEIYLENGDKRVAYERILPSARSHTKD